LGHVSTLLEILAARYCDGRRGDYQQHVSTLLEILASHKPLHISRALRRLCFNPS